MKICWDMLEGVHLTTHGNFRKGENTYIEMSSCKACGKSYLTVKEKPSMFCCHPCSMFGKTHSMETKKKISKSQIGKVCSIEVKKRMSIAQKDRVYKFSSELKKKMSERMSKCVGSLNHNYKGGIKALGLTTYDTCKDTLGFYEDVREQFDTGILEVKCAYCGKWYTPTYKSVTGRLTAINNLNQGECRLYCSENCKLACPTYNQKTYPKGFKHATSREVSTYLRQMVLERDNWTCQICGKTIEEAQLHVHHMDPVVQNPMFQNDMDSCVTLCKSCHKMVHSRVGCRYIDLRCKKIEQISESKVLSIKGD